MFVVGKGGVGRSSLTASLAAYYAQKKENVLVVQWSLSDSISPIFSSPKCAHKENAVPFHFSSQATPSFFNVMNFNSDTAIEEYFVDHLKMKLLYSVVIQSKHVQKLIHAAPGISELFFLGRLFWLMELAKQERGTHYDRIIVDCPATGHGISLFGIAKAVANLGMTGPLALECERVAKLLSDQTKTAALLVTLPEELPTEECIEFTPILTKKLGYSPKYILMNKSVNKKIYPNLNPSASDLDFIESFDSQQAKQEFNSLVDSLLKRNSYEDKLQAYAQLHNINFVSIPDFNLTRKQNSSFQIVESMVEYFNF